MVSLNISKKQRLNFVENDWFFVNNYLSPQIPILISGEELFKRSLPQKSGFQCDTAATQMIDFIFCLKSAIKPNLQAHLCSPLL